MQFKGKQRYQMTYFCLPFEGCGQGGGGGGRRGGGGGGGGELNSFTADWFAMNKFTHIPQHLCFNSLNSRDEKKRKKLNWQTV